VQRGAAAASRAQVHPLSRELMRASLSALPMRRECLLRLGPQNLSLGTSVVDGRP
jgi:hypothetical protein